LIFKIGGALVSIQLIDSNVHAEAGYLTSIKASQNKINAEDAHVEALLAQAEYIFNNADEFVTADVEEMMFV